MGFGFLLFGYFLSFFFSLINVYFFADVIGAVFILIGCLKLRRYGSNFARAAAADVLYIGVCLLRALGMRVDAWANSLLFPTLSFLLVCAASVVLLFFMIAGVYYLSLDADMPSEARAARRNLVLTVIFYLFYMIAYLLLPREGTLSTVVAVGITVFDFLIIAFNTWMLYVSMCKICLVGEEDVPVRESRIPWVAGFFRKTDRVIEDAFKTPAKDDPEPVEPGYLRVKRKRRSRK